ncbi:MAG: methyltransferase family protein [Candidatus Xenobia bacterium]
MSRFLGCLLFGWYVWKQIQHYSGPRFGWCLMLLLYVYLVLVYLFRPSPRVGATRWQESVIPWLATGCPFLWALLPPGRVLSPVQIAAVGGIMLTGHLLMAGGVISLSHSFAIRVEARTLVRDGVYRFMRHPIYVGECLTLAGAAWQQGTALAWLLLLLQIVLQTGRARMEDRKLGQAFGEECTQWQSRVGAILPRF